MSWTNNCILYCDGINYELVGSGHKAENCNRFTMKEFFRKQKEKSSCQM